MTSVSPAHEAACRSSRRIMPTLPTPLRLRAKPTLRATHLPVVAPACAVAPTPRATARVPRAVALTARPTERSTGMRTILADVTPELQIGAHVNRPAFALPSPRAGPGVDTARLFA